MRLLGKEIQLTVKSLTFWLVVVMIGAFLYTQFTGTPIKEPQPNQQDYGTRVTKDKDVIMSKTLGNLYTQHLDNQYPTYPWTFLKVVKLSKGEQKKVEEVLEKAAGKPLAELNLATQEESAEGFSMGVEVLFPVKADYSYAIFEKEMSKVSKLLGKNSSFAKESYETGVTEPQTYAGAKKEFDTILEKDHVVGAYARMMCDYLGIILALVPVFLAATVVLRDRRSQSQDTIFTKSCSTLKLMGTRFLSVVVLITIAVMILAVMPSAQMLFMAQKLGVSSNPLIVYGYLVVWLLPTIIGVCGLAFLTTTLLGGIFAVVTGFVMWFVALNMGANSLGAYAGWNLIPRFNQVGGRDSFETMWPQLIQNRLLWTGIGLLCFFLSVWLLDQKRKGGLHIGKNR